ncbi:putative mediator of RNA polymerase II transcription subunit 10 [Rosellinia necatrix]|uniref:Mediator of RNA polymerase II transcription subunit 10 n=1 Tax=Rosellinia necatrix TaxID=77044 RepID=A0A1S8A938_ROSNE|nr:putative mediator of RNA polymerase II transcription subunit 10 [Rosellinia necatrix]
MDHNHFEQQLKDTIQCLHNIMVQVTSYDAATTTTSSTSTTSSPLPSTTSPAPLSSSASSSRDVLAAELTALSRSLRAVHRAAAAPPAGGAAAARSLPSVPPELVQYVDNGRNPDVYTREFVELVRRGNQLMRGKRRAFAAFRDVLAAEIAAAMPELRDDAARVLAATASSSSAPGGGPL